ncbi:hypothetical protein ABZY44_13750 [Streptomyces sp. NPDC006544]|uniref:hypothetical protein n=1 Tax=Streptomyces sp. NPDC006544 TaxID=3154583 RepID=UPI0033A97355
MSNDRTPIAGPIPIYVEAIPAGAVLDMAALTEIVVQDVLEALLEQDTTLWDRLHEVAELTPETAQAEADAGRLPYEELVAALAGRCSSRVPLYGPAVLKMAAKLQAVSAVRPIPGQRGAA